MLAAMFITMSITMSIISHHINLQEALTAVIWALHFSTNRLLISLGSTRPVTSLTLILDLMERSFPSIFAPKRGADLRVEKSELCTPGW
jgi:hypothetical protein